MAESSESRCAEMAGPPLEGWGLSAGESRGSTEVGLDLDSSVAEGIDGPPLDLSFRLAEPGGAPFADRSIGMTRTHGPSRPSDRTAVAFPGRGQTIGGFRIVSELGRGAFARVYLAEQIDLAGRAVALKVAAALGDEPQALARLQHTHIVPIHSVHDDPATGLRLLCMPFVGGANLAQVLERSGASLPTQVSGRSLVEALDRLGGQPATRGFPSPSSSTSEGFGAAGGYGSPTAVRSIMGRYLARLPWWKGLEGEADRERDPAAPASGPEDEADRVQPARRFLRSHTYVQAAVWIGARLAEGLDHAHSRGILHRDLKPSNILIASDGTPMLLDFNLSADANRLPTERVHLGGTLPYMAPEHLDAFNPKGLTAAAAVDERSDIYALGLILFEMVAGRHAFDEPPSGLPLLEAVAQMTEERRRGSPAASSVNPMVPPSLDAAIAKALDPDPARRYARACDLAEDLQRFLDDRPNAHAPEPSLRERAGKWWRRHPGVRGAGPVAATAAALLIAVAAASWTASDYAEKARAKLARNHFKDEFARCQLLLNTTSGTPSHRKAGVARAEGLLETYGVTSSKRWLAGPLVSRLSVAERTALREDVSELMLLLVRARVADSARGRDEAGRRKALEYAVAMLDRAEAIDPDPSAALYESRASYHRALGESGPYRADRAKAEGTPPRSARDYYLRGTARASRGDADGAESDLSLAVAMDPRRFWAWFVLGLCHADAGRYAEAVGDFNACTLLAPEFAWPYLNRGLALAASGRLAAARASFDRAVALSPDFAEALVDRALTCLELDDPAQAERDLGRALALGRRDSAVLAARAEALSRLGRRDQAERDFAESLKARPGDPTILIARGISRIEADPKGAEADFDRVLERNPRHARAHYGMALLLRKEDPTSALAHANRSLDADPRGVDALRLRAVLLGRRGDPAALADADRLAHDPSPHNLYNAACALSLLDRARGTTTHQARVREYLRRAIDLGFPPEVAAADPDLRGK